MHNWLCNLYRVQNKERVKLKDYYYLHYKNLSKSKNFSIKYDIEDMLEYLMNRIRNFNGRFKLLLSFLYSFRRYMGSALPIRLRQIGLFGYVRVCSVVFGCVRVCLGLFEVFSEEGDSSPI